MRFQSARLPQLAHGHIGEVEQQDTSARAEEVLSVLGELAQDEQNKKDNRHVTDQRSQASRKSAFPTGRRDARYEKCLQRSWLDRCGECEATTYQERFKHYLFEPPFSGTP